MLKFGAQNAQKLGNEGIRAACPAGRWWLHTSHDIPLSTGTAVQIPAHLVLAGAKLLHKAEPTIESLPTISAVPWHCYAQCVLPAMLRAPSPPQHGRCPVPPTLTPALSVPRCPSRGGGCTTPAPASPAWRAHGLLPASSGVCRTSGKRTSSSSRSCSARGRAARCVPVLVVVVNKVLTGEPPISHTVLPRHHSNRRCDAVL